MNSLRSYSENYIADIRENFLLLSEIKENQKKIEDFLEMHIERLSRCIVTLSIPKIYSVNFKNEIENFIFNWAKDRFPELFKHLLISLKECKKWCDLDYKRIKDNERVLLKSYLNFMKNLKSEVNKIKETLKKEEYVETVEKTLDDISTLSINISASINKVIDFNHKPSIQEIIDFFKLFIKICENISKMIWVKLNLEEKRVYDEVKNLLLERFYYFWVSKEDILNLIKVLENDKSNANSLVWKISKINLKAFMVLNYDILRNLNIDYDEYMFFDIIENSINSSKKTKKSGKSKEIQQKWPEEFSKIKWEESYKKIYTKNNKNKRY